jgi:Cu+-exporting ATPase
MMIGDGLNDVLSLQEAGVGVSINAKSELNLLAADVIILNENLWKIVILFNLMNLANKVVYINLVWAFAYNIIIARNI